MKVTVDRIEGDLAVLLVRGDESVQFLIPLRLLPPLREGDILDILVTKDEKATEEARERVSALIDGLKMKDRE
ncbi:MAG: DUF3006 family protein [Methanomicrobiales archaeon]|nr:DUF3006 family protein [Methanomicrobiales archaeon]MDI6875773.1 DUF3006 family protein [Methanomicrobiales archaeon]